MKTKILTTLFLVFCILSFAEIARGSGLCDLRINGTDNQPGTYTVIYRIYNVSNSTWATGYSSPALPVNFGNNPSEIVYLDLMDTPPQYRLYAFVTWTNSVDTKTEYGASDTFSCDEYYAGSIPVTVTFP
jgi:hypothetical protein